MVIGRDTNVVTRNDNEFNDGTNGNYNDMLL